MKKIAAAAAVLLLTGCATVPQAPQVNRTAKADKYAAPKKAVQAPMPTPNQTVQRRWFPKFRIQWLHPK